MEKESLYRYTGGNSQLFGVRKVELQESNAKGITVYEVTTADGLRVDVLADNGLDLGQLSYRGKNMSFMTSGGLTAPQRFIPYEDEFLHTFPGGMMYTCGMRSVGPPSRDDGQYHSLHGRYHSVSANNHYGYVSGDKIVIGGIIRETALFGHILELKREITIPCYGSEITINDTLTNQTPEPTEIMMLYHINFGYPMLSEDARLVLPEGTKTTPRNETAQKGLDKALEFTPPADNEPEQVFFHQPPTPMVTLENKALGTAAKVEWSDDTLFHVAQWKSMASGNYALGIEPSNNYIMGRIQERENGSLKVIDGFGSINYRIKLNFNAI